MASDLPPSSFKNSLINYGALHGQAVVGNKNRLIQFVVSSPEQAEELKRAIESGERSLADTPESFPLPSLVLRFEKKGGDEWLLYRFWGTESLDEVDEPVSVTLPSDDQWRQTLERFHALATKALETKEQRQVLEQAATAVGDGLSALLVPEDLRRLHELGSTMDGNPFLVIECVADEILSLPWELLRYEEKWLARDGQLDLARSVLNDHASEVTEPTGPARVRINVCAPEEEGLPSLDYERESYHICQALHHQSDFVTVNEMGEVDDLVEVMSGDSPPEIIHYSGHGSQGALHFEDEVGAGKKVTVQELISKVRGKGVEKLPGLFYLACCYGQTAGDATDESEGVTSTAACLHREGIPQIVAHHGPVYDRLATSAEAEFYAAIAEGKQTRVAIRRARQALTRPFTVARGEAARRDEADSAQGQTPFAWALLVLYQRGRDFPLGEKITTGAGGHRDAPVRRQEEELAVGGRSKVLHNGFIGRRKMLHRLRKRIRNQEAITIVQGIGGIGKSVFCLKGLTLYREAGFLDLSVDCAAAEKERGALNDEVAAEGAGAWFVEQVLTAVGGAVMSEKIPIHPEAWEALKEQSFQLPPQVRLQKILAILAGENSLPALVFYLDNLESLMDLEGAGEDEVAPWCDESMAEVWATLTSLMRDQPQRLSLLASTRYQPRQSGPADSFPLPELSIHEVFRLLAWFRGLSKLSHWTQVRLLDRVKGHGRAVEFLDGLVQGQIDQILDREGALPKVVSEEEAEAEYDRLVSPCLDGLAEDLRDDLLFDRLWERVLTPDDRHLLIRLTAILTPANYDLVSCLWSGEESSSFSRLRALNLVETLKVGKDSDQLVFITHPLIDQFVEAVSGDLWDRERQESSHQLALKMRERFESTRELSDQQLRGLYHLAAEEHEEGADLLQHAGEFLANRGQVSLAMKLIAPLVSMSETAILSHVMRLKVSIVFATIQINMGKLGKAAGLLEKSIASVLEIDTNLHPDLLKILSVSHNLIGEVRMSQGDLNRALKSSQEGLAISEQLAAHDPGNAEWQRDSSVSQIRIGRVRMAQGDLSGALQFFREGLAIRVKLAAQDSSNASWQRDLAVSHDRIGEVFMKKGDLSGALQSFQRGLAISEKLATQDPGNVSWLRGLSINQERIGGVRVAQGDLSGALQSFQEGLFIRVKLAAQDPGNAQWQRDLSVSHEKIGEVRMAQGDLSGAFEFFQEGLAIRVKLATRDPSSASLQRDLSVSFKKLGEVTIKLGKPRDAILHLKSATKIDETLVNLDPENLTFLIGYIRSLANLGQLRSHSGPGGLAEGRKLLERALELAEDLESGDRCYDINQKDLARRIRGMIAGVEALADDSLDQDSPSSS